MYAYFQLNETKQVNNTYKFIFRYPPSAASVNQFIIGLDNGLSPIRRQAII